MRIYEGAITQLAMSGHLTLQVPDQVIGKPVPGTIEVPDDWFVRLKDDRPVTNKRESGFLFLSRKGWEANKSAFVQILGSGVVWKDLEAHAAEHFAMVERKTQRYLQQLREKIAAIENVTL